MGVSQWSEHQTPTAGQAPRKCYPIQGILLLWTHQDCIVLENFISNLDGGEKQKETRKEQVTLAKSVLQGLTEVLLPDSSFLNG